MMGFQTPSTEGFYGFGERFTWVNQRYHRVGSWLEDGSWGVGVFGPADWKLRVSIFYILDYVWIQIVLMVTIHVHAIGCNNSGKDATTL